MIGSELGHYRIDEKLGEGGMGVVYKAQDIHLDRPVAIKVLSAEAVADPERKRRFVQEARTASSLNHPNILHIYDIDQANGVDFMVMEFVQGKTLDQLAGHTGLPLGDVLNHGIQIAGALARAHDAGIVHRDIKPANIMVTPENLVKVLDFGLAKLTEPLSPPMGDATVTRTVPLRTEPGVVFGTVEYMAPEQAEGKTVDARSDIFSLGAALYEVITGTRPFQGASKIGILAAVLSKEPVPIGAMKPDVPPEFVEIVTRCLRKEPEQRFQHMSEVKAALEQLQDSLRTPSVRTRAVTASARSPRRKWLWPGVALVTTSLIVAAPFAWRAAHVVRGSKLIAVLPFQSASADPASQAYAAGLTEVLGRRLMRLNQFQTSLRILPPGDVPDDAVGPAEARRKLGAGLVLTGSVERMGPNMHWSVTLTATDPVRELQHRGFDVPLSGPPLREIAKVVELRLTPQADQMLAARTTTSLEAYDSYIQAYGFLQNPDRAEDVDRAIDLFQTAIAKDPSFAAAQAGLAESYWAKNSLSHDSKWSDQARENCLRAIAVNANLPDADVLLGEIYNRTGHPHEAVEVLRRALRLDPLNIDAHTKLGESYEALGQFSDSEAAYRSLVELWPSYLVPYSHLGAFYFRQGRFKDAEPVFRKMIELVPGNAGGYQNLGGLYHLMGRTDEAAAMMKKALSIKPSASGYTNLGTLYFFQGRYSDAVPLMEKAVEMGKTNYVYWGNLGDAYRWVPEYKDRAVKAYREAIKLGEQQPKTDDADLRSTLAAYYAKLPDPKKALDEIGQARRLAPMNPKVLFKAALVYELIGRREQALSALDLALQNGYSIEEVQHEPSLAELRKDPRYHGR